MVGKPTCLESDKIPGRYQANIMPCMSTIMHGVLAASSFNGGYHHLSDTSSFFDSLDPCFEVVFGSLSA